ncbi:hypothetical protein BDV3_004535 [Batrachochytrium dendrobatidis]
MVPTLTDSGRTMTMTMGPAASHSADNSNTAATLSQPQTLIASVNTLTPSMHQPSSSHTHINAIMEGSTTPYSTVNIVTGSTDVLASLGKQGRATNASLLIHEKDKGAKLLVHESTSLSNKSANASDAHLASISIHTETAATRSAVNGATVSSSNLPISTAVDISQSATRADTCIPFRQDSPPATGTRASPTTDDATESFSSLQAQPFIPSHSTCSSSAAALMQSPALSPSTRPTSPSNACDDSSTTQLGLETQIQSGTSDQRHGSTSYLLSSQLNGSHHILKKPCQEQLMDESLDRQQVVISSVSCTTLDKPASYSQDRLDLTTESSLTRKNSPVVPTPVHRIRPNDNIPHVSTNSKSCTASLDLIHDSKVYSKNPSFTSGVYCNTDSNEMIMEASAHEVEKKSTNSRPPDLLEDGALSIESRIRDCAAQSVEVSIDEPEDKVKIEDIDKSMEKDAEEEPILQEQDIQNEARRKEALVFLSHIETYFARIQQLWYSGQAAFADREAETIRNGTHPSLCSLLEDIEQKHTDHIRVTTGLERIVAQRNEVTYQAAVYKAHTNFLAKKLGLRKKMQDQLRRKRWQLHYERAHINDSIRDAWILDEETRIKRRRIDQANVDEWNSVMEEFPGFPACTLSGLSDKDRELDFKELGMAPSLPKPAATLSLFAISTSNRLPQTSTAKSHTDSSALPPVSLACDNNLPCLTSSAHTTHGEVSLSTNMSQHISQAQSRQQALTSQPHMHRLDCHQDNPLKNTHGSIVRADSSNASTGCSQSVSKLKPQPQALHLAPSQLQSNHTTHSTSGMPVITSDMLNSNVHYTSQSLPVEAMTADGQLRLQGHWYKVDDRADLYDNGSKFTIKIVTIGDVDLIVQRTDGSKTKLPLAFLVDGRVKLKPKP